MKKALILICLLSSLAWAQATPEAFYIRVHNSSQGAIEVSSGDSWVQIGQVIYPIDKVNQKGFTASQWISPGMVAATAVNAVHIKVSEPQTIFSILPMDFLKIPRGYNSYLSPDSSIYTSIPAGNGIFGGEYSPFVGNEVVIGGVKLTRPLAAGDVFDIRVERPVKWPRSIVFENRFGGAVTVKYPGGDEEVVAEVLRPVQGVGRFAWTRFINPGRIRANHPGVIDISTAVGDKVGGFQIIPNKHAQSPEMLSARVLTQWMVVGPTKVSGQSPEGLEPLFKGFLKPQYDPEAIFAPNWQEKMLKQYVVEVKMEGEEGWKPMPIYSLSADEELPPEANKALIKVKEIRILFPLN